MNTDDDDTPPMRPVDRSSGPRPLSKKHPEAGGVSPPRASGEPSTFDTDNLWDDSDVRDILAGLDQVKIYRFKEICREGGGHLVVF